MGVRWLAVSWQGVKLSVQAGALRPVADMVVPSIVPADFSSGFWRRQCHWRVCYRGCHVGLPELLPLIPSIGMCLGFARMVIMIPVLVG